MVRRPVQMFALVSTICLGCGEDILAPETLTITVISGANQVGLVGTALDPIVVRVDGPSGDPQPGVTVLWSVNQGSISPATTQTDVIGVASAILTLGSDAGQAVITASVASGRSTTTVAEALALFDITFSDSVKTKVFNSATGKNECRYAVSATATGGAPGVFALWINYDVEFRYSDGSRLLFEANLADAIDFWGSDRIITGSIQTANRIAMSARIFDLVYTFRYSLASGEQRSTPVFIDCA